MRWFVLVLACFVFVSIAQIQRANADRVPADTVCFPEVYWDAKPGKRPCIQVRLLWEDGAASLRMGTANKMNVRCYVPNPAEERKRFKINCWKVKS